MIIAFCGAIGSGKTTAAKYLVSRYGFIRVRFADPLKQMLRSFGLTEEQVDGTDKEVPSPLLIGKTPRYTMQMLGTEWGRNLIDQDLWVKAWQRRVDEIFGGQYSPGTGRVVVDDVRFPNEEAAIRRYEGEFIQVCRPGIDRSDSHSSEGYMPANAVVLDNDLDIRGLRAKLDDLFM